MQDNIAEFIATKPDVAIGLFIGGIVAAAIILSPALKAIGVALALVFKIGVFSVFA